MVALKNELQQFLHQKGIALIGIASLQSSQSITRLASPHVLLSNSKSAVCYGIPIPKGLLSNGNFRLEQYWRYCNIQYRQIDIISNKLCNFLERYEECQTMPIYSCFPWNVKNREFWGAMPLIYLAEEAGLGCISKCGLLITPEYGTRILLGATLTTLALEPDPKISRAICPSECFICVDICPVNAIDRTGKVDHDKCIRYSGSNPLLSLSLNNQNVNAKFPFETLINTVGIDDHGLYTCMECIKACPFNQK